MGKTMSKRMIKTTLMMAGAVGVLAVSQSKAVVLYSNLVPTAELRGDQSINGPAGAILDDVLIDNTINNVSNLGYAQIDSVVVGLVRGVGAGPVDLTGYYGTTTTPLNPNAFPVLNEPQTAFGTVSVPAYTGLTKGVEYYTITPSSPFIVALNLTDQPTFSEFALGLNFSNQNPNGWVVANNNAPDTNLDGAWDSNLGASTNSSYSLQFQGNPIYTTVALQVNGSVVPEPAGVGLIASGFALMLRRRGFRATI
jgi:hypothetical protein